MREIEFRAWDGRRFHYLGNADFILDYTGIAVFREFGGIKEKPEWKLTQYTGLKDKHGVEIYEGDILNIGEEGYAKPETVVFENGAFGINASWIDCSEDTFVELNKYCNFIFINCVEIIGNIYENPVLTERQE